MKHALRASSVIGLLSVVAGWACSSSAPADDCSAVVDRSCAPAYEPSFDNVFQHTLKQSCALAGPSCHAAAGAKAGLVMEDADTAYRNLVGGNRVVPGKPECSVVTRRIVSSDISFMMPPGMALAPAEQCAIIQWIAKGAPR